MADSDTLPYVYRITKYDPAGRDTSGHYIGTQVTTSDHGPIEAAYLQAVAAFAADAGVERLAIREPEATSFVHFGAEPAEPGHGLTGIFPPDLTGYHGDGVLRARWRTEPTESDRRWAVMKTLRRGQVCTGTVTAIPSFLVTFVDIGGVIGQINIPEPSWRHIEHPTDVVSVGQEITVKILDVDMVRERVALSLRAAGRNL